MTGPEFRALYVHAHNLLRRYHLRGILADHRPMPTGFTPAAADLDRYAGTYASAQIPLKIVVTHEGTGLKVQATGQPAIPVDAVSAGVFKFDAAGLRMEFSADQPTFKLKQGGGEFEFKKE